MRFGAKEDFFSKVIGEAEGTKDIGTVLSFEFPRTEDLGIAALKTGPLGSQACLKVSHERLLVNGVAVREGITIREDVVKDSTPLLKSLFACLNRF